MEYSEYKCNAYILLWKFYDFLFFMNSQIENNCLLCIDLSWPSIQGEMLLVEATEYYQCPAQPGEVRHLLWHICARWAAFNEMNDLQCCVTGTSLNLGVTEDLIPSAASTGHWWNCRFKHFSLGFHFKHRQKLWWFCPNYVQTEAVMFDLDYVVDLCSEMLSICSNLSIHPSVKQLL